MVELNQRDRTINIKIVYYGPAVGGKTTNIQMLHQRAASNRRGELVSVNSAQDRTIMFDLLPLKAVGFRGFDLKIQLLAVPGQAMYAAIRRLLLKSVDSLVFVANSAADRQEDNIASFKEMTSNLVNQHIDPASLPLVFQYNKRDLPAVSPTAAMNRVLNARLTAAIPAVAVRGEGVLETFSAILALTVEELARRYRLMDMGKGQSFEEWTAAAIQSIFGASSFAAPAPAPLAAGPELEPIITPLAEDPGLNVGRRTVRMVLPTDVSAASQPDARANEALVESYAEAAASLGEVTQLLREERDLAQRRLADLLQVLELARAVKPGASFDPVLAVTLECLAQEVNANHASFLLRDEAQGIRVAALRGLRSDPFLADASAIGLIPSLIDSSQCQVLDGQRTPALLEALTSAHPPFGSVVCVPCARRQGSGGLALLYLEPNAAPPSRERLAHITALGRALTPFFL